MQVCSYTEGGFEGTLVTMHCWGSYMQHTGQRTGDRTQKIRKNNIYGMTQVVEGYKQTWEMLPPALAVAQLPELVAAHEAVHNASMLQSISAEVPM